MLDHFVDELRVRERIARVAVEQQEDHAPHEDRADDRDLERRGKPFVSLGRDVEACFEGFRLGHPPLTLIAATGASGFASHDRVTSPAVVRKRP